MHQSVLPATPVVLRLAVPNLKLWLLGSWQAHLNGVSVPSLPTRHARTLLARLALAHPTPISRADARADVFGDMAAGNAARSLRTTLYYLRRALGEVLWSRGEQIGLDPQLEIWTDVVEFEASSGPDATGTMLDRAIASYRGG